MKMATFPKKRMVQKKKIKEPATFIHIFATALYISMNHQGKNAFSKMSN